MYSTEPETRKARKPHICSYCGEAILVGEQYKRWTSIDDSKAYQNKMHPECLWILQEEAEQGAFEYTPYSGERPSP